MFHFRRVRALRPRNCHQFTTNPSPLSTPDYTDAHYRTTTDALDASLGTAYASHMARPGTFTAANAVEMGKRSAAARAAEAQRFAAEPPQPPPPLPPPLPPVQPTDEFIARKLARVRTQIERVEDLLTKAVEPQAVDRFAAALARLYEIERNLAGRPLPGSRRPKDHEPHSQQPGAWIDVQPVEQPQPAAQPIAPPRPMGWEYDDPAQPATPPPPPSKESL